MRARPGAFSGDIQVYAHLMTHAAIRSAPRELRVRLEDSGIHADDHLRLFLDGGQPRFAQGALIRSTGTWRLHLANRRCSDAPPRTVASTQAAV